MNKSSKKSVAGNQTNTSTSSSSTSRANSSSTSTTKKTKATSKVNSKDKEKNVIKLTKKPHQLKAESSSSPSIDVLADPVSNDKSHFDEDELMDFAVLESQLPKKAHNISLSLLKKRSLRSDPDLQPQQIMKLLNEVTHVRLDRENLQNIDGLELLGANVRNLYLQHNEITTIEGLETLTELRFLTLSHNKISKIQQLRNTQLGFLDLSHNLIDEVDINELPKSLVILNLDGNLCQHIDGYRQSILAHCSRLSQLDGKQISIEERRAAGHEVISESEGSEDEDEAEEAHPSYDYSKPFDAAVVGVFDDMSSDMFLRCQSRIQYVFDEHRSRLTNLERLKTEGGIMTDDLGASRMSSRLDSPDTTDSSRPDTGNNDNELGNPGSGKTGLGESGYRLAQVKLTNAAILADSMASLSNHMTNLGITDNATQYHDSVTLPTPLSEGRTRHRNAWDHNIPSPTHQQPRPPTLSSSLPQTASPVSKK